MFGAFWSYFRTDITMSPIGFAVLAIAQLIALFYYINKARTDLLHFFKAFDFRDFNKSYNEHLWNGSEDELKVAFNNVLKTFRKLSLEREEQYQYLRLVNEQISVGIISFKKDGSIDLMNNAARSLLNIPMLGQIEQFANHDEMLWQQLNQLEEGRQVIIEPANRNLKLAVTSKSFRLVDEDYTLISFQDISSELEEGEMDAWQKLIRVLTHEIMNSVTPVVSLTTAVKMIMQNDNGQLKKEQLEQEELVDVFKSITAIEKRGQGLLGFVKAYRDYTRPPVPEIDNVNLFSWVNDTVQVIKSELKNVQIKVSETIPEDLFIKADEKLMSQVLINLLKNSSEAIAGSEGEISISAEILEGQVHLHVRDNGSGIPENIRKEIFVPFFTTKKQGNGIGLSLSKQIMKAHKGDITVESNSEGTIFTLKF